MSDQQGAISDLEELFLAREFGRPSGRHLRAVEEDLGEAPEPRELEEVFRSRDFGRPVALELLEGEGGDEQAPNVVEFPFAGPGAKPLDRAVRQRAVAALSGVAAAALILAGLVSAGGHSGRQDVAALAHQSTPQGGTTVGPNAESSVPDLTPPGGGAPVAGATTAGFADTTSTGGAGGAAPAVVFAGQPVATPIATPSGASAPGSGGTPPAPDGGSGLAPVTSVVGNAVGTASSTVSGASGMVTSTVPTAPTAVAGTMGQTANDVSVAGQSLVIPAG